jgi:DNA-directed RNA polymerase specialized sigma24 family protein
LTDAPSDRVERFFASSAAVERKRDFWRTVQNTVQTLFEHERAPQRKASVDEDDYTNWDALREGMASLRPDQRAILLRKIAGFSSDEIADGYHPSADAVEAQIERVKRRVRKICGYK